MTDEHVGHPPHGTAEMTTTDTPTPYPLDDGLRDRLAANLAAFDVAEVDGGGRRAAVAVTLVDGDDGAAAFVLTRRNPELGNHAGQWALPGGRLDPGETVADAALRELAEEVGVDLDGSAVLGRLDDYQTRSGFVISPVVVWAGPDTELRPDPSEVATAVRVPVAELDRPDSPRFLEIPESDRPVVQVLIGEHRIHAPTAALVHQFGEVALHGRATRVAHLEQPVFAWS